MDKHQLPRTETKINAVTVRREYRTPGRKDPQKLKTPSMAGLFPTKGGCRKLDMCLYPRSPLSFSAVKLVGLFHHVWKAGSLRRVSQGGPRARASKARTYRG